MTPRNKIFLSLISCITLGISSHSYAFETAAKSAILLESGTGKVLFEKDADVQLAPASTSKLMTVYLVFDALAKKQITEDTEFFVSENARSQEGSRMFLENASKVKVIDLLHGAIIQSGNDACVTLAEGLAGSTEEFVSLMNKAASDMGLKHSHFMNATGLPDPEHYMSARDLSTLAAVIIKKFPEYYKIYSHKDFTWNGIKQGNRNPLLYGYDGADGMKTGHTEEAGYNLVGSAKRKNMRLISVVTGLKSMNDRGIQTRKLMDYGFGRFFMRQIGVENFKIADLPVYLGDNDTVTAVIKDVQQFPVERGTFDAPKFKITYQSPLIAPIAAGTKIGTLTVIDASDNDIEIPLYAKETVESASLWGRLMVSLQVMFGTYETPKIDNANAVTS